MISSPTFVPARNRPTRKYSSIVITRSRREPCNHRERSLVDRWNETITASMASRVVNPTFKDSIRNRLDILLESVLFGGIGTMVACISELTSHNLTVSSSLLTVLGIVLGLVIGFRTTSAYERYQEGRKLWADIAVASGSMAQVLWTYIPDGERRVPGQLDLERMEVLNLIQSFSIAAKHFLCFEQRKGCESELVRLVPWLPGLHNNMTPESLSTTPETKSDLETMETGLHRSSKPTATWARFQHFIPLWMRRLASDNSTGDGCERCPPQPILPLQIGMALHDYVHSLKDRIPDPVLGALVDQLRIFHQSITNLERIRSTPIPYAYQVHLQFSLWLYLTFLPFQIVDQMKWATIPGTLFASMLLLGFHAIGQQIENPFNGDANDLDMNAFTECIAIELREICQNPGPASFNARLKTLQNLNKREE